MPHVPGLYPIMGLKPLFWREKNYRGINASLVFSWVRSEGTAMNDMFLRGDFCFGRGNILLAGEAAGLFYLNGEGISVAIDSGYRAGSAIARSIKGEGDAFDIYYNETEDIRKHVGLCASKQTLIMGPPQAGL